MATPTDMKKIATWDATGFDGLTSRNLWTSNFIQIPAAKTAHPNTCKNGIKCIEYLEKQQRHKLCKIPIVQSQRKQVEFS